MSPVSLTRTRTRLRLGIPFLVAALAIVLAWVLSATLPNYFVFLGISAVTASISILGLGIVTGSAGMIALCQLTFAAVGAWIVSLLNLLDAPGGFLIWLIAGAAGAGLMGILVGLPALRLRGVNLAVVTLGFAAAAEATLVQIQFPGATSGIPIARPALFASDASFFFLSLIVLTLCALAVYFIQRGRWGASWKAVAFSERAAAAAGESVRSAKLTAFAVSAALAGIAGGLLAGQVQLPFASSFNTLQSLAIYVLAVMMGTQLIDMAILGGILWVLVPELLKRWGIPQDWAFVVFGLFGMQSLASGTNLGQTLRSWWWKLGDRKSPVIAQAGTEHATLPAGDPLSAEPLFAAVEPEAASGDAVLRVEGLSVTFGSLKALDDVSVSLPPRSIMGLIGPNGAGKSTFVDAVSGFLPQSEGRVMLGSDDLSGMSPARRARAGLRRTFQQDRVPPSLTVSAFVRYVARRRLGGEEIEQTLAYFDCPPGSARISDIDVGTRRLIEVAAHVLARPRVLLLDEPAAGLSHKEHLALASRLRDLPERYGLSIIIIEHDLDLVRSVCPQLTVLDFGRVLASGPQSEVLADPVVTKAYMGDTEILR
ncbi:ABC transporter permease subunit [Arthrobacter sulfonylureivorans]|uniref:ATP-binding cassette domain-containing protein n=1 Tax=Arthrobacter sulfonylureivorans TaxID=2486855 RepID=A0ABY3WJB3_9MICC|nr:ATP-binding cassette domain-containing protein [Arthrobacter sulfonylureivorans]UNK47749.1 ATP-binding cassette domain-containing protein [Arthrobacter sulfonylureivorans]